ncbi:MAG: FtsQ-type POTRA domain-containing protein [Ruminococcaceae bacterium]|nr:FtsQ-type POTRA domain-containing protein [Oscillospiraceae bacterium]
MDTKEKTRRTPSPNRPPANRRVAAASEKKPAQPQKTPQDVVYLPPKPLARGKLLLRLATVAAIVIAIVLAMSVFFKVEYIEVSGVNQYTPWDISEASGIREGDHLMSFGIAGAAAKIMELPYVKDVRIAIKLPNRVLIEVTEVEVTYAVKAQDDAWWLLSSKGQIVEKAEEGEQEQHTKILGVHVLNPVAGQSAVAQETHEQSTMPDGTTVPPVVTSAQQLSVALDITEYLENNGIIGDAQSIDVNDLGDIQIWYGSQYQVKLGDTSQLSYKISFMKQAIEQRETYDSGVMEIKVVDGDLKLYYTSFQ